MELVIQLLSRHVTLWVVPLLKVVLSISRRLASLQEKSRNQLNKRSDMTKSSNREKTKKVFHIP